MTGTFSSETCGDAARAAELRRIKALATLVLVGTLALFVTTKAFVARAKYALPLSLSCRFDSHNVSLVAPAMILVVPPLTLYH